MRDDDVDALGFRFVDRVQLVDAELPDARLEHRRDVEPILPAQFRLARFQPLPQPNSRTTSPGLTND